MRRLFRDLPLLWKLLVPYLALLLMVGSFGTFLLVRDLRSTAQATLDRDLARRSLDAGLVLHEEELSSREGATLAANLQGMAAAVTARNADAVNGLIRSVLALKAEVRVMVVVDGSGQPILSLARSAFGGPPTSGPDAPWADAGPVTSALASSTGASESGLVSVAGRHLLIVAAPVCTAPDGCAPVGATVVGLDLDAVVSEALVRSPRPHGGLALFDPAGTLLATRGPAVPVGVTPPPLRTDQLVRRNEQRGGHPAAVLYAPVDLGGRRAGVLAVDAPIRPAFSSVRSAAWRIALVVLAAALGAVGIGVLLARFILAQVRPLLATNRALESGDLHARSPVLGRDELGVLAAGVNQMAARLQANYETLEERVRSRTEEVERLLRERTELFTSVSHEFRTPLAVILAQAESLQDASYPKTAAWCAEVGHMVEQSGRQLLAFVNDVLELAQAEAGGLDLDFEAVDVRQLVRELQGGMTGLAAAAGVDLTVKVKRGMTPAWADRLRLREVILNLVDNAVKYTPTGGKVVLGASNGDGRVTVTVTDTGVGIPPEVGDRIFEPFFRVKGTRTQRAQPSSGLGLAVTHRLVEAQGGSIAYESVVGRGTTFTLSLPARPDQPG